MKLREHPSLIRKSGFASWPPQWKPIGDNRGTVQGELGILEDVSMHDSIANKIFLAMDHRAERYIAVLAFDDETFAKHLYPLLIKRIGSSLCEIGELDLSHLL